MTKPHQHYVIYQEILDAGIEESKIERLIGEGWDLEEIWDRLVHDGEVVD